MKRLFTPFLFFLTVLNSCGDIAIIPLEPFPTEPKNYLWSGGLLSRYVYETTHTLRDSAGRDSTYTECVVTKEIKALNTMVPIGIRGIAMDVTTIFNYDTLVRTDFCYVVDDLLFVSRISDKDTIEDTLLAGSMRVGGKIQSLPYPNQKASIISDNEFLQIPAGKFRVLRTEVVIDSGNVITNLPNRPINSNGTTVIKSYYSPGRFVVKEEITTQYSRPFLNKWRSSQYTTVLRSVELKK